jgi:hypothetical protein
VNQSSEAIATLDTTSSCPVSATKGRVGCAPALGTAVTIVMCDEDGQDGLGMLLLRAVLDQRLRARATAADAPAFRRDLSSLQDLLTVGQVPTFEVVRAMRFLEGGRTRAP